MTQFLVKTYRTVTVRRQKKRNSEAHRLALDVPVDVADIRAGELRTAYRAVLPGGDRVEFFAHGKSFVCPMLRGDRRPRPVDKKESAGFFAGEVLAVGWENPFAAKHGDPEIATAVPADTAEILSDDADDRSLHVRKLAAGFAIVDGKLWRPHSEPVWTVRQVEKNGPFAAVIAADCESAQADPGREPPHRSLRADRVEDADRLAQSLAKRVRRRHEPSGATVAAFEVDLFKRDDRRAVATDFADAAMRSAAEDGWLVKLTRDGVENWVDLRDGIAAARAAPGFDPDELAGKAGILLREIADIELGDSGTRKRIETLNKVAPSLIRWRDFEGGRTAPRLDGEDDDALGEMIGNAP